MRPSQPVRRWQVTAIFPGGGKTTFGIKAADEEVAVKVAARRLAAFPRRPAAVQIELIPPLSER